VEEVCHVVNGHKVHILAPSHWRNEERPQGKPTFGFKDSKKGIAPSSSLRGAPLRASSSLGKGLGGVTYTEDLTGKTFDIWEGYLNNLFEQYSMNLDKKGRMKPFAGVMSI
jgi:hypothetical protein